MLAAPLNSPSAALPVDLEVDKEQKRGGEREAVKLTETPVPVLICTDSVWTLFPPPDEIYWLLRLLSGSVL